MGKATDAHSPPEACIEPFRTLKTADRKEDLVQFQFSLSILHPESGGFFFFLSAKVEKEPCQLILVGSE